MITTYHILLFFFSLLNVRSRFHELEDLIGDLGDKISNVASSQEKEFLSAYRVHMLSVQLELKELKLRYYRVPILCLL